MTSPSSKSEKRVYVNDSLADYLRCHDDVIDLRTWSLANFNAVLAMTTNDGDDPLIDFGSGNTLRLEDVQKEGLHADDFLLA